MRPSLSVRCHSDLVALCVGEYPKGRPRHLLDRLNDRSTQFLGLLQCGGNVFYSDKEQHLVVGALTGTDREMGSALGACVDEGETGKAPSEATFQPNRPAKNCRVASGSWDRISAWMTGCGTGFSFGRGGALDVTRMTNHYGEIDTTARTILDQRHSLLGCFEMPRREFFPDRQSASSVVSEAFDVAVGPTVLIAHSRRWEQSGCRNREHEPVAHITLRC